MPVMPLDKWQEHLEGHFAALAASRVASGFPIFALEHGLGNADLDDIAAQLNQRLQSGQRLAPHWLLWAVYAAERGYAYSGEEYWRSFEDHTPGWSGKDRYRVPRWFEKFQKAYNGVVPSGPWAEQFRLIAWPITHAVLPRYLQMHFARTLYELRFRLAGLTSIEPAVIGRMIAANAYHTSTRFEEFLQQEELVGRIVLALLHKDPRAGEEPLLPLTLERIAGDLEQVRHAREWLKETVHVVTDRFTGIGRGRGPRVLTGDPDPGRSRTDLEPRPDIRPDLRLRYAGHDSWTLVIEVPSFKSIAALNADIQHFLKTTRCRLNGDDGKKPAGWILSGNRRAVLKSWPDPEAPLIGFDHSQGTIDHLLHSECRMSDGPAWLFRIGRDGNAREIASRLVRPGFDYILASKEAVLPFDGSMRPCSIACEGITALRISVPTEVPADYILWLKELGLELARTIRVWPAGLPGRSWDGEGRSEWLTTEMPCFGIMPDHPVDSYVLTLDNGSSTIIRAGEVGSPTFIRLPQLDRGTHLLTVRAKRSAGLEALAGAPAHEGFIELRVRDPEPWQPGTTAHAGLVVTGDPHDAGLDIFWQNRFALSVAGPENRSVTATVLLENAKGEQIFSGVLGTPFDLPVKPETWRHRFDEFLKREQCQWRYLEASTGILKINGQELGEFTLRFQHEALPVRWVLHHDRDMWTVRLVDDTGEDESALKCRYFGLQEPARAVRPDTDSLLAGVNVQPPGGLFVAQSGKHHDAVVVSTGLTGEGLAGLGVTSRYDSVRDDPASLVKALRIAGYWRKARLAGFVADARRQKVLDGLFMAIYGAICGPRWAAAEAAYVAGPSRRKTDELQAAIDRHGGFTAVLRRDAAAIEPRIPVITSWYADLAKRYGVCRDAELCGFAVRLACRPYRLDRQYSDDLEYRLDRLKQSPVVLRGARFIALLCAAQQGDGRPMMPRWGK